MTEQSKGVAGELLPPDVAQKIEWARGRISAMRVAPCSGLASSKTAADELEKAIDAILALLPVQRSEGREAWRHKVRGSVVEVLGKGRAQASTRPIQDMDRLTFYQHDGELWARHVDEFEDGRFEKLSTALPSSTERAGK